MKNKVNILSIIFLVFITGCQKKPRIETLELDLLKSNSQIEILKKEIEDIKFENIIRDIDKIAFLTPGQNGYSKIQFDLGVLTVQLLDIKPYANGTKVTLKFGNIQSATINGLKATLDWGKVDERGNPINDLIKTKEINFDKELFSGAWTKVFIVLENVTPNDFGFLRIRNVSHTGIRLIQPQ